MPPDIKIAGAMIGYCFPQKNLNVKYIQIITLFMKKQFFHTCGFIVFAAFIALFLWLLYQYLAATVDAATQEIPSFVRR
jgi:hypothetical protein